MLVNPENFGISDLQLSRLRRVQMPYNERFKAQADTRDPPAGGDSRCNCCMFLLYGFGCGSGSCSVSGNGTVGGHSNSHGTDNGIIT